MCTLEVTLLQSLAARRPSPRLNVADSWIKWLEALAAAEPSEAGRCAIRRELANWLNYSAKLLRG